MKKKKEKERQQRKEKAKFHREKGPETWKAD